MPTEELRDKYIAVDELIMDVLAGSRDGERDAWHEDLDKEPNTLTRAINATADEIKRLYDTYPTHLREPPQMGPGWYFDHLLLTGRRYWDGSQWTEHTAP
jgi:hypothetical protein